MVDFSKGFPLPAEMMMMSETTNRSQTPSALSQDPEK